MNTARRIRHSPRNALITGSSQGLGKAFADECASRGMNLFLVALPDGGLPEVAQRIHREWGVAVEWLEQDLTTADAPDRVLAAVRSRGFDADILVNNAGIGSIGPFRDSPLDGLEATMRLNVLALVRLTHTLIPELERHESAYILNVASLGALFPMPYLAIYSATKSFVLTFGLALREELRGAIHVSTVCPNTIRNDRATEDYVDKLPLICRRACLYASEIARRSMDGLLRGRAIIVPGSVNGLLRAVCPLVPRPLAAAVIRRLWGGFGAEARDAVAAGS